METQTRSSTNGHRWKFFRAGGVDQVQLSSGADVLSLGQLDQKLWVALACPIRGIEFNARTLQVLDTDGDGRIRPPEIKAAIGWIHEVLKEPDTLFEGGDSLRLAAINSDSEAGAALLSGARRLLQNIGKGDATTISLADLAEQQRIFADMRWNGDGVVPPDAVDDMTTRAAIADILRTLGGAKDKSGKDGVDQALCDAFFAEAAALCRWHERALQEPAALPLGEATLAAAAALERVAAKVDDYFARCRLASFDGRAAAVLSGTEPEFTALAHMNLGIGSGEMDKLPLARVEPGRPLPLLDGTNPSWAAALKALLDDAVAPLFGGPRQSLSEAEWTTVKDRLAAGRALLADKPHTRVEALGLPRLRELVAEAKAPIDALIQQDAALGPELAQLASVEKLLLLHRDLVPLLRNFVNFSEFYGRRQAMFQAGTLYLDGRSCDLCVRVDDPAKHASVAGLARTYLAYCDCTRPGNQKMTIVAAFTAGDSDNLMVGRNGVFYDREGHDWDATITKIVENPMSIGQAFWAPYKRLLRLMEEQLAKRATTADSEANERLKGAATSTVNADRAPAAAPPESKIDAGTVAAIGVAVAGLATFLSSVLATFFGLGWWMPLGLLALMLAISGPSMFIAWLKLRQRNLGPLLDASGWAINGRVKINVPFGAALTSKAALPAGSQRQLSDPYAEKGRPWWLYGLLFTVLLVALAWYYEPLARHLPAWMHRPRWLP